jgi:hypothetical protein
MTWCGSAIDWWRQGALVGEANHETHLSLYARDPDGLEFELTSFVPADKLPAGADRTASHPSTSKSRWRD